jgi:hypothetical protein
MSLLKHILKARYHDQRCYDTRHLNHRMSHHHDKHAGSAEFAGLLESIIRKRALATPMVIAVLVGGVILIILGIFAVSKLLPMAAPLLKQFEQVGVNGLVDMALGIMKTIFDSIVKG